MKILLIVEQFGGKIPTGIISYRIAKELLALGNEVIVLTAYNQGEDWSEQDIYRNKKIKHLFPATFYLIVSNLLQINLNSLKWRKSLFKLAKGIVENRKPDVIYARSTPISVCEVAAKLSAETGIPSLLHFTDPVPAPPEWDKNALYRRRMVKTMNRILPKAVKVSFGNAAMLDYEQSIVKYPFSKKSFVSADPVSSSELYIYNEEPSPKSELQFVYFGSLYGNRNPQPLFDALNMLHEDGFCFRLDIYDVNRVGTQLPDYAHFVGRTDDIKGVLLSSDILIDLDGDDKNPVFISSKIKEYLCYSRPILSITPDNSPSHEMTRTFKTVFHSRNKAENIEIAIRAILSNSFKESDYEERIPLIKVHTPMAVAQKVYKELQLIVR